MTEGSLNSPSRSSRTRNSGIDKTTAWVSSFLKDEFISLWPSSHLLSPSSATIWPLYFGMNVLRGSFISNLKQFSSMGHSFLRIVPRSPPILKLPVNQQFFVYCHPIVTVAAIKVQPCWQISTTSMILFPPFLFSIFSMELAGLSGISCDRWKCV